MKGKKILLICMVLVVVALLAVVAVACKKGNDTPSGGDTQPGGNTQPGGEDQPGGGDQPSVDTLAVPSGLSVDQAGKATWGRVTGATGYEAEVNGAVVTSRFTNLDLLSQANLPLDGRFVVKVRTVADAKKSDWSEAVTFDYRGGAVVTPQVSGLDGTVLSWTGSSLSYAGIPAPHPVLTVGGEEHSLPYGTTSFDLADVTAKGELTLGYVADGVYLTDSAKVELVYDPATRRLAYGSPKSAYMDGGVLRFSEVSGVNTYYFKDVYNTVTSLTGADINALSSDRAGKFLVKQVWVGNTDLDIDDSDPVDVTYFASEQGEGTEQNPYLISDPSHLRYIEYYEAMGLSRHYKLAKDIAFEPYSPQPDEDYSNFYNLGSLSGVLDGDGHTLGNIVVYYKDGYSSIFDSITKTGAILNLTIENADWRTWTNRTNDGIMHEKGGECAILAYTNNGLVQNVTLRSGSVTAVKDGAAGLVSINRGTIKDCVALQDFAVSGANEAGAFAIYNAGTIEHCINYAAVSGRSSIGGIVGRNAGLVTKCGNHGEISGEVYTGGIVGYNYNVQDVEGMQYDTLVSYCYNRGQISGFAYAGGIVGRNGSDGRNETGSDRYANAGVVGCYNQGAVSGIISVGGVAGQNFAYHNGSEDDGFGLVACYNSGDVNSKVEGFESGRMYLSVAACSWAEVDSPDIYAHFWKGTDTAYASWPGVKMEKVSVGDATFYSVKMPSGYATNQIAGVIFCRVNPENKSEVFNQTDDVTQHATRDSAVYYIDGGWTTANLVQPCWGAIAGYNNMINDCYYVAGRTVGGTTTSLKASEGGVANQGGLDREGMRGVYAQLNAALGEEAFAAVEGKYPVLKWELEE